MSTPICMGDTSGRRCLSCNGVCVRLYDDRLDHLLLIGAKYFREVLVELRLFLLKLCV